MMKCLIVHRLVAVYPFLISWCSNANAFLNGKSFAPSMCHFHRSLYSHPKSGEEIDDNIYPLDAIQLDGRDSTLVPDIAYYYLRNTIGLSEETMWKVTLEAGSVLGMTPRNLEKKISLLRRTMDLSDEDIRVILGKQPAVLHYSAERNLAPTILFLVRALDLSKSELRSIIMECPSILGYASNNLNDKLSFFMDTLGYNTGENDDGKENVRELFIEEPKLLSCGVETGLIPRMRFLHREIQFSLQDLRKLYGMNPRLLLYNLDTNLREKIVFFFILGLQMEPQHVRKLLLSYPKVMDYNLENHMRPIANYFMTELEFSTVELRSIVLKFPRLFTHSLYKIKHVIGFLRYELSLDAQQVKRVVFQSPQIIGLDTEGNLKEKLHFLQQRVGLTQHELTLVIAKMPTILCLNVETNLIPKIEYLEHTLAPEGADFNTTSEIKEVVLKLPTLLGYSLEKRIQPRMEELLNAGIKPNKITVGIPMNEDNFKKWIHSMRTNLDLSIWNSAAVSYLCSKCNFSHQEIKSICARLPDFADTYIAVLQSRISYLEDVFETEDIRHFLLEYPALLDVSPNKQLRRRLDKLRFAGLPLIDNINTVNWDIDKFDNWVKPKVREATNLKRLGSTLVLRQNETEALLSSVSEISLSAGNAVDVAEYLLTAFSNSKALAKEVVTEHPALLLRDAKDLRKKVERRLNRMDRFGVSIIDMPSIVTMADDQFDKYLQNECFQIDYTNETAHTLSEMLDLREPEVQFIISRCRDQKFKDPKQWLLPKLSYMLSKLSKKQVAACFRTHPNLLHDSLEQKIIPRIQMLVDAGVSQENATQVFYLSNKDMYQRSRIQKQFNLTGDELKRVVPFKMWLEQIRFRCSVEPKLEYLSSQLNNLVDLKQILLDNPSILRLSLTKQIIPRVKLLLEYTSQPSEIASIMSMSATDAEKSLLKLYFCNKLDFSEEEANKLLSDDFRIQHSFSELIEKMDYLLTQLFEGATSDLKRILLSKPAILQKSLKNTLMPRVEALQLLRSVDLGCTLADIGEFLTKRNDKYEQDMVPTMMNWDAAPKSNEGYNENDIWAALHEYAPPLVFASSNDFNRETARIVHWGRGDVMHES